MKMAAICFSDAGAGCVRELMERLREPEVSGYYKTEREQEGLQRIEGSTGELVARCFEEKIPLLFVGACGIALRLIAPFVKDKLEDIPVLVMDEAGQYVIPLLSGHVGGANRLARIISEAVGAVPVITTATDVQETFSVDSFAVEQRLNIGNREGIKKVSSKMLRGEPIRIYVQDTLPGADVVIGAEDLSAEAVLIPDEPLRLSPKRYVLGIGCRRGKTVEEIESVAEKAMEKAGIGYKDIYAFASVHQKAEEKGLLDFSARHRLPFVVFSAERLERVPGVFASSAFVRETVGVDNVCERAAVLLSGGGRLVTGKLGEQGVTAAVAERVRF